jgi:hypothetical protein
MAIFRVKIHRRLEKPDSKRVCSSTSLLHSSVHALTVACNTCSLRHAVLVEYPSALEHTLQNWQTQSRTQKAN